MNILAIETSSKVGSIALMSHDRVHQERMGDPYQFASQISVKVGQLCQTSKIALSDIDWVIVGSGPGSFTGIRVGIAYALGLAFQRLNPILTTSSLELIQISEFNDHDKIMIYLPSYNDSLFISLWEKKSLSWNQIFEEKLVPSEEIIPFLKDKKICWVGPNQDYIGDLCLKLNQDKPELISEVKLEAKNMIKLFQQKRLNKLDQTPIRYIRPFYAKNKKGEEIWM